MMQLFLFRATALFLFVLAAAGTPLAQGKRVALVIGNAKYKHTSALANPGNDAADVAAELRKLGFEVIEKVDLDKAAMDRTIRNFAETLSGAKVALFSMRDTGCRWADRTTWCRSMPS
ncbi:MAG: hypothetical protein HC774_00560 [Sphingomonadales bacterium]|nr:hypothetical protein [Sphingomonadales bacterium]